MWDEEDRDDGLGVMHGLMNAFIILVLMTMIIGTIWGLVTK